MSAFDLIFLAMYFSFLLALYASSSSCLFFGQPFIMWIIISYMCSVVGSLCFYFAFSVLQSNLKTAKAYSYSNCMTIHSNPA